MEGLFYPGIKLEVAHVVPYLVKKQNGCNIGNRHSITVKVHEP